jgi:proteasome lid subunit RPN8/RPN11
MRWTDVPAAVAHRTVAAWRESMRGIVPADALERVAGRAVARTAARKDNELPLVVLASDAFRKAWDHVVHSPHERGGLLLGESLVSAPGDAVPAVVFLRTAVPGLDDDATGYSLRLAAGVWDAARAALLPGECVVGWFHSHPDLGAFFSDTDRRTQAGFFRHPFSVGWVIDPVRREQAWFVGPRSHELANDSVVSLR